MTLSIKNFYNTLYSYYGETGWWPGDTDDEVVIGAMLTQNTSWRNVELSLNRMKKAGIFTLEDISRTDVGTLGEIIRSSGFYNQKSQRLKALSESIGATYGNLEKMKKFPMNELENFLRPIKGIGQETLDSILLYALEKPVFVVDKYAVRIVGRIGISKRPSSVGLKDIVSSELGSDIGKLKNLHGMIVNLAKDYCKTKPRCAGCPMQEKCDYFTSGKKSD